MSESKFAPSSYQQAIFDFIKNGEGSAVVEAVAGSGKTTTIIQALELIPSNQVVAFLAFNRSIANELEERVRSGVNVMTMNGLGHRAWGRHVGSSRIQLNKDKTWDILQSEAFTEQFPTSRISRLRSKVRRLVNLAKQSGIVPAGVEDAQGLVSDVIENWRLLAEHHDVEFLDEDEKIGLSVDAIQAKEFQDLKDAVAMAREVLRIGLSQWNVIDFDDQLYMTVVYNVRIFAHDWLFVDEAQDISPIQRVLIARGLRKGKGRLVAVGDPHQAIYGFRGADSQALASIRKEFNAITLPLSISYRCSKSVVREAQKIVPHILASETAPEGQVVNLGTYDPKTMNTFQAGDFVICRNTAPLVRCAFDLIKKNKAAKIMGRDLGKSLVTLIEKLDASDIHDLRERLEKWAKKEVDKALKKNPDSDVSKIFEKVDCIEIFIQQSEVKTVGAVCNLINNMFDDESGANAVRLSTIHKAKGLEADRVLLLNSFLLPSKYAKKQWQKEQENNLAYVGVTRARQTLAYINAPKEEERR